MKKVFLIFSLLTVGFCFGVAKTGSKKAAKNPVPLLSIVKGKDFSIVHTTRGADIVMKEGTVKGFQIFPAGRYKVEYKDEAGKVHAFLIQTEGEVGHLQPVDPGATKVNGFLASIKPGTFDEVARKQSRGQVRVLLKELLLKWGKPSDAGFSSQSDSQARKLFVNAVAAIYANGKPSDLQGLIQ